MSTCFSIVPLIWSKEDRDKKIAYLESTFGIGMIVGPPLSAMLYAKVGYLMTFAIYAVTCALITIFCVMVLPVSLNLNDDEEEDGI